MKMDFDTIVVGSGAGGASFAHACALAGKRVLIVERGRTPDLRLLPWDEKSTLIDKVSYDDRTVSVNGNGKKLYMGGVMGGGTALYGGALLRPSNLDFHPGKSYGERIPRHLWDWPIEYDDLTPFYSQAEALFHVTHDHQDQLAPLNAPSSRLSSNLLPLAPINQKLIIANRAEGLQPFRLPLAIDTNRCLRCHSCAGFLCPEGARRSSAHLIEESRRKHSLEVMSETEVELVERGPGHQVRGIVLRNRSTGVRQQVRAKTYALAAGAIGSPAVLLRSKIEHPHLGRNYMMHYSPIAVGIFPRTTGADDSFLKQIGFADFYFGTKSCPDKMGLVQSLPAPGPLMLSKAGLRHVPKTVLSGLRKRMLPLAGIVEDLPDPNNRVFLGTDGTIGLEHRFSVYDKYRGKLLGREMKRILKRTGAYVTMSRSFPSEEHVAHQCGTLRMGKDPRHAVVDRDCRMFGLENLFVVDGSVLPTSLGVGPSLTIVANALRVAQTALRCM